MPHVTFRWGNRSSQKVPLEPGDTIQTLLNRYKVDDTLFSYNINGYIVSAVMPVRHQERITITRKEE